MASITIDRRDGLNSAAAIKGPCRVATTANITLSGLQTIDGVALAEGDRVLVKDQTDARDNGIRIVSTGNWERSADFRNSRDIVTGTQVYVTHGTVSAERWYGVTAANPISVGTTNLTFAVAGIGDLLRFESIADIPLIKLDSKIIFKKNAPTNSDAWDFRIWRDATGVAGGAAGLVNAALLVDVETGASEETFEWSILGKLTNNSASGQNSAGYFQATKKGQGPTWSMVLETREDPTATYGALIGMENACSANGTDFSNVRVITDIIGARYDNVGAVPDFFAGVRITAAWNGDVSGVESARFKRPLLIDANWTDTAIFAYKRLAIDNTITSKVGLMDMFVPEEGGNTNEFDVHFTKTGATVGWETTGLFLDRVVDDVLMGRVAFGGDRSVSLSTGAGGSTATLVHSGGFAVPAYAANPAAAGAIGQMIWVDSLNRLRVLGSDGVWHQVAFES